MNHHRNKRDANESRIVEIFGRYGHWEPIVNGTHDGNFHSKGVTYNVEIKDGAKPPSKRELTPRERKFKLDLQRQGVRLWMILCEADALALCAMDFAKLPERDEYRVGEEALGGSRH